MARKIREDIKTCDINDKFGVTESQRTSKSLAWFNTARENLQTANILLSNKRINHCVFFLQQCIECIIKGILIENNIVHNAKDFNHHPEIALEHFFEQNGFVSIEYCKAIKSSLAESDDFEIRLRKMAKIINKFTIEYSKATENIPKDFSIDPSSYAALGLPTYCSDTHAYLTIEKMHYTQNVIYCFAILFGGNQIEQNTRYPMAEEETLLPTQRYCSTPIIIEGLTTCIPLFESILKTILHEDLEEIASYLQSLIPNTY